jgi:myosin heavy subunit
MDKLMVGKSPNAASSLSSLLTCFSVVVNLKEELASQQKELKIKSEQLIEHNARIERLETELNDLKAELQEKQEQVCQLSHHGAELESKTQSLERHLEEVEATYQEKQARQNSDWESVLRTETRKFRRTEEELQKRIETVKPTDCVSEEKFKEMAKKLQDMGAYARKEIHSLEAAKTSMGNKIVTYESQLTEKNNKIEQLSDKLDDLRNGSSLVPSLSGQLSELRGDIAKLHSEKNALEQAKKTLEQVKNTMAQEKQILAQQVSRLEQEKRSLNQRILELEKVRLVEGVVICVDLSSSLKSTQVTLAKEAFRTITSGIRSRNPKTHIGVIVQATSISIARNIDVVDLSTDRALNSEYGGGAESYHSALPKVQTMLSSFHYKHPKARRRIILIGDGQTAGGYPENVVSSFRDEGIPIHSVVIRSGYSAFSSSSQTSHMSSKTGGQEFSYAASSMSLSSDALLGRV